MKSIEQQFNELIATLSPEQIKKVLTQVKTNGPVKVDTSYRAKRIALTQLYFDSAPLPYKSPYEEYKDHSESIRQQVLSGVDLQMDIETVQAFIRGKEQMPIMHVKDKNDPDYKSMRKLIMDINPNTEDYMHNIASKMNNLMSTLRHMEPNDYDKIVNTFKKYNTDDMNSGGISGDRTYGYDKSRVDGRLIKRKRGN